ncbi:hypothetical protein [Stenotrophomonas indicatrix]|uniref:hypothetical protein n=1 Tax=Stenotrophomonas indicatrix TaxID=2045451 RepID=UPI003448CD7D
MKKFNALRACAHTTVGKIAAGSAAIMASGAALASGGASPGAAIAGELSGGKADMALIIGAVAVFIGFLLVWAYTKRAAK